MRAFGIRTALAVCVDCVLPAQLSAIPQDPVKTKLASDPQLQSVLLQARDAVVAETHLYHASYGSEIATDIERVTRFLLLAGNRADVLYVQQHSEDVYAEDIRGVLRPAVTLEDFAERARVVEGQADPYIHDGDIELIVEQEIERGFLEDALQETKLMRLRLLQTRTMGALALAAYIQGDFKKADQVVAEALETAASNEPSLDMYLDHTRMLIDLASRWHEGGYDSAALGARQQVIKFLQRDTSGYQGYWRDLGVAAAQQGDLKMAAQVLEHVSDASDRGSVQVEMQRTQARMASPARALEITGEIRDNDSKFSALLEIAGRQTDAGDKVGAAHTLKMALEAAEGDDRFLVYKMAEIAWKQIGMGDKSGAEATIAEGLGVNEKLRAGSDQVNGWMMLAEDLSQMGEYDRALEVARKIEDAEFRARALQLVAYRETVAGHGDWALAWVQGVEDPEGRARTLVGIAGGLIQRITGKDQEILK